MREKNIAIMIIKDTEISIFSIIRSLYFFLIAFKFRIQVT